ncbi:hypothetical protein [uncultured Alsobacter sp.]|uniref:hypothetical protein n=1 Tax=uncultured Alsobacter sp. TaxID=1748258 RepID=UPI0025D86929|nr:hypothetical protein [uncultured Alsobacter sp.]
MSYAEITTASAPAQLSDAARTVLTQLSPLPSEVEAELSMTVLRVSHSSGIAEESIARLMIAMARNIAPAKN